MALNKRAVRSVGTGRRSYEGNRRGCWRRVLPALLLACLVPGSAVRAQIPILEIIKAAVKKVIVATDLEVERLQTETIGLQNTEKEAENDMALSELNDIKGWVQDQRDLFAGYYQELWEVKNALATYEEVKDMVEKQVKIVSGYRQAFAVLSQDKHFSGQEVSEMDAVLSGIGKESEQNISRLWLVVNALVTQMGDGPRLKVIDETGRDIDRNYSDLVQFSQRCYLLSAQRAQGASDLATVRAMYGIE